MMMNEFSRVLALEPWPEDGIVFDVAAAEAERRALARRFDLADLAGLALVGRIERLDDGDLRLTGRLEADATQRCAVTLEPVPCRLSEPVERLYTFVPEAGPAAGADVEIDPEVEEPEFLPEPVLDLGEVAAEALALGLDPYPRSDGADAALEPYRPAGDDAGDAAGGPFAELRRLRP